MAVINSIVLNRIVLFNLSSQFRFGNVQMHDTQCMILMGLQGASDIHLWQSFVFPK